MTDQAPATDARRTVGWLPDAESVQAWVEDLRREVADAEDDAPRHPSVDELRELLDRDGLVRVQLERRDLPDAPPPAGATVAPTERPDDRRHLRRVWLGVSP